MKNRRIDWVWGINLGVRTENYPQIEIYRSPKISHESYVAFDLKRQKLRWPPTDVNDLPRAVSG